MLNYRIDVQQDDGSWAAHEFYSSSDDHAIAHAVRLRTANTSQLYQAERWLATFDRSPGLINHWAIPANDNDPGSSAVAGPGFGSEVQTRRFIAAFAALTQRRACARYRGAEVQPRSFIATLDGVVHGRNTGPYNRCAERTAHLGAFRQVSCKPIEDEYSLPDDGFPVAGSTRLTLGAEDLFRPGPIVIWHAGKVIDELAAPVLITLDYATGAVCPV